MGRDWDQSCRWWCAVELGIRLAVICESIDSGKESKPTLIQHGLPGLPEHSAWSSSASVNESHEEATLELKDFVLLSKLHVDDNFSSIWNQKYVSCCPYLIIAERELISIRLRD